MHHRHLIFPPESNTVTRSLEIKGAIPDALAGTPRERQCCVAVTEERESRDKTKGASQPLLQDEVLERDNGIGVLLHCINSKLPLGLLCCLGNPTAASFNA
jgi:hypothetical protein